MASSLTLALLSHSPLLPQESPLPSDTFLVPPPASSPAPLGGPFSCENAQTPPPPPGGR